ncbi:ArsR/SmtB family transcription factor [Natronosalvus rutilus]|uniref:Helix-turn-helix domain-containing protein n=1 Tax=Natronosalvus rutilus TaxID=2953753 RepID=A0A9E7NDW0_9EURY|nr:winged helix-turn-helix domain-containing protein [Natronosalvus rutilus]UTF55098.1 helix-turn-helix domain-containing protein [Natronosalvus rutilus]
MNSTDEDGHIDPVVSDAIDALGNDHRLEILFALADREWEVQENGHVMSFTDLYDAVDVDSTSQFSYHLKHLVGQFLEETPDGYRLTYTGEKIVRTIRSGLYESTPTFEAVDVAGLCPFCRKSTLVADSSDERFVVRCTACDSTLLADAFPRSQAAHRSPSEIAESFGYRIWSAAVAVQGGVCPECYAPADAAVDSHDRDGLVFHTVVSTCDECRMVYNIPVEVLVALHPAAIEFLWRQRISIPETPLWELFGYFTGDDWTTDVRSISPLEARFELSCGDETLVLEMGDDLEVTPVAEPPEISPESNK